MLLLVHKGSGQPFGVDDACLQEHLAEQRSLDPEPMVDLALELLQRRAVPEPASPSLDWKTPDLCEVLDRLSTDASPHLVGMPHTHACDDPPARESLRMAEELSLRSKPNSVDA